MTHGGGACFPCGGYAPLRRHLLAPAPDDLRAVSIGGGQAYPRRAAPLRTPAASLRAFPRFLGTSPLLTLAALFLGHSAGRGSACGRACLAGELD